MDIRYELHVFSSEGREIHGKIAESGSNLISQAQEFLEKCRVKYPETSVECCEVWEEVYRGLLKHLVTVY